MKLCDIGFDRYDEVMAKVPELIENLAKNEEFKAMMFRDDLDPSDLKAAQKLLEDRVAQHFPKLMLSAKKELIAYFALIEGVSEEEYTKNLTVGGMIGGVSDMLRDKAFLNFFGLHQTHSTE